MNMNRRPQHSLKSLRIVAYTLCLAVSIVISGQLAAQTKAVATLITGESVELKNPAIENGMLTGGDNKLELNQVAQIDLKRTVSEIKPKRIVYLADGGKLFADSVGFTGEWFAVNCDFGELLISPDSIRGVVFKPNADLSRFERALNNRSVEKDYVIADRGGSQGTVQGLVETVDNKRMRVSVKDKSRSIAFEKLVAIVTADLKPNAPNGTLTMATLSNGSMIKGGLKAIESGTVTFNLSGNSDVSVPLSKLSMLSMQSDRVAYLSDLDPTDVEENSLATVSFPWKRNTNVLGQTMQLRTPSKRTSQTFTRGVGAHASSRLEFPNEKDFDRLAGLVGIDASTDGRGDCVVSIWGDGIKLWEKEISGSGDPEKIDLDVSGMKSVALVVRNGKNLDLGDHVNWANIRLMKTKD